MSYESNTSIIKVTGFGETRFMKATKIHDGKTLLVQGFAAKLGQGRRMHGVSYLFTTGIVDAEGAYVAKSISVTILNRTGLIIGFWDNAKHNQYASNHINYRFQEENNVPAAGCD